MNSIVALPIVAAVPVEISKPTEAFGDVSLPDVPDLAAPDDAELFALLDQYLVAYKKFEDLHRVVDQMDGVRFASRKQSKPETLTWREQDAELGLPLLATFDEHHEPIWDRVFDVDKLRPAIWEVASRVETDDELIVSLRKMEPSPAARARADEIIAAYDDWSAGDQFPRGYWKAKRESDKAQNAYIRIERRMAKTRAKTVQGMLAKVRCAEIYDGGRRLDFSEGGCSEVMAHSIFRDLRRL